MSEFTFSGALIMSVLGYVLIWLALDGANLTEGVLGGALLGSGVTVGLLGR